MKYILFLMFAVNISCSEVKFSEEDYQTYVASRKLADIVYATINKINNDPTFKMQIKSNTDGRNNQVNPKYGQTEKGIFLSYVFHLPGFIKTPWGSWEFGGNFSMVNLDSHENLSDLILSMVNLSSYKTSPPDFIFNELSKEVKMTVYSEEKDATNFGYGSPVYKVHQVQDIVLPEPSYKNQDDYFNTKHEYFSEQEGKELWDAMTKRYDAERLHEQTNRLQANLSNISNPDAKQALQNVINKKTNK